MNVLEGVFEVLAAFLRAGLDLIHVVLKLEEFVPVFFGQGIVLSS